jgi:glycosyltransferase involved in cell wall biosynthesis
MVAPISHPYPPSGYGPWERVAHDLTEGLVEMGHDVTLFAPAGSSTQARLVATVARPLDSPGAGDARLEEETHLAIAMEEASRGEFDVMHSHLHVHALVFSRLIPVPLVTTLHGAAWNREHHPLLRRYAEQPFVSLSDRERSYLPELNYVATIPNGVVTSDFAVGRGDGGYLAFVGRMAPEKAPDLAIEVALEAGMPLRMAGIVEDRHRDFFDGLLRDAPGGDVEYLGALDREQVATLLGGATGTLMPLRWNEPFGLVVVESLAVGTPVVAWRMGAMPEIVEDGETGFLVDDVDGAVAAVSRLGELSRSRCRASAVGRFGVERMAVAYSQVYADLVATTSPPEPGPPAPSPPRSTGRHSRKG